MRAYTAAGVLVLALLCFREGQAQDSWIAFDTDRGVELVRPDRSGSVLITPERLTGDVARSIPGTTLIHARGGRRTLDLATGAYEALDLPIHKFPVWSPGADMLAFASTGPDDGALPGLDLEGGVYVSDLELTDVRLVPNTRDNDEPFDWSVDGERLLLATWTWDPDVGPRGERIPHVDSVRLDGSDRTALVDIVPIDMVQYAAWSPDRTRVVVQSDEAFYVLDPAVADVDWSVTVTGPNSGSYDLGSERGDGWWRGTGYSPQWSPSGDGMATLSPDNGVYVFRADGSDYDYGARTTLATTVSRWLLWVPDLSFPAVSARFPSVVQPNAEFFIEVAIVNASNVAGYTVAVDVPDEIVQVLAVEEGDFLTGVGQTFWQEGVAGGTSALLATGGASGKGTLVVLRCKALGAGEGSVSIAALDVGAPDGKRIPVEVTSPRRGFAIVVDDLPAWHIDLDGTVDIVDLLLVARAFGAAGDSGREDVNRDGVVDILDLIVVAQHFGDTVVAASPARSPLAAHSHDLRAWLQMARDADDGSVGFARGMRVLRQLAQSAEEQAVGLLPNYPNPFNPETWIPFSLPEDSVVTIRIYSGTGAAVRTFDLGYVPRGDHRLRGDAVRWDGRNDLGEPVASGAYTIELDAGGVRERRRVTLAR